MADYIDRGALRKALSEADGIAFDSLDVFDSLEIVDSIPSADVAPVMHGAWKHVQWVKDDEEQAGGYWISRCSNCIMPYHSETPYCPHCGAKMDLVI